MTAPYVVRNEQGEYKTFDLPTEGPGPYGASILLFLGLNEYLDVNLLSAALKQSIVGEPPGGTWYKTAYLRAIRTAPIDSAPRAGTLPFPIRKAAHPIIIQFFYPFFNECYIITPMDLKQ